VQQALVLALVQGWAQEPVVLLFPALVVLALARWEV
jgi:hypothetical protein